MSKQKPVKTFKLEPKKEIKQDQKVSNTKKMRFNADTFYNLDLLYTAGQVADVPNDMVERWLRRGAVLVDEPSDILEPVLDLEEKKDVEPTEEKEEI